MGGLLLGVCSTVSWPSGVDRVQRLHFSDVVLNDIVEQAVTLFD